MRLYSLQLIVFDLIVFVSPFVFYNNACHTTFWIQHRAATEGNDDEVNDADEAARIAKFKARLMAGGLDAIASKEADEEVNTEWARLSNEASRGTLLMGENSFFFGSKHQIIRDKACERVGLPKDVQDRVPKERLNALLPVILLLDRGESVVSGLMLGRRSGYLMGDFKQLDTSGFLTQPLWIGGPSAPDNLELCTVGAISDESTGILALHPYQSITNSQPLTPDGLYVGGDWNTAKLLVDRGMANPFRFRLFAQATSWSTTDFDNELKLGAWRLVDASTELILKDRPRGADIWADIDAALTMSSSS